MNMSTNAVEADIMSFVKLNEVSKKGSAGYNFILVLLTLFSLF